MLYIEVREQSLSQLLDILFSFYCSFTDIVQYYYNHGLDYE